MLALGIVTGVSAVIGGIGGRQTPRPAATAESPARAMETASPAPSPTTPPTSPEPTPTDAPGELPALEGAARLEDPEGDVTGPDGEPPPDPEPAADLVAVQLEGDGAALHVAFELVAAPPDFATSLLWSLDIRLASELAYTITIQQLGEERYSGVLDWQTSQMQPLEAVAIDGQTLKVTVPAELLPKVAGPFTWSALGQQDDAYEDFVPDDPEGPLPAFPS